MCVYFANYFKFDPDGEIRLNPMGEIMLNYFFSKQ